MKSPRKKRFAYTLVEILVAVTLSLMLMLGVTEMFRHIGTTLNDTQSTLGMSANLNNTALQLRSDLAGIKYTVDLSMYPHKIHQAAEDPSGYLEITEGMGAPYKDISGAHLTGFAGTQQYSRAAKTSDGSADRTVGDTDDILAFTTRCENTDHPFRGLIGGDVRERENAEIIWFVRGNTLYRRVLLLDPDGNGGNYDNNDVSMRSSSNGNNNLSDLARREYRFAHSSSTNFPYPLYDSSNKVGWYFLRMPTMEETVSTKKSWTVGGLPNENASSTNSTEYWDFWENPNDLSEVGVTLDKTSGSLSSYVDPNNRHSRAGEDIILTNVISFDVKVWNPYWVPLDSGWAPPQYIDLGQDQLINRDGNVSDVDYGSNLGSPPNYVPEDQVGYGFTLKGRYNTSSSKRRTHTDIWKDKEHIKGSASYWSGPAMPCVFDTWSQHEEKTNGQDVKMGGPDADPITSWTCPPPYDEQMRGIQVTIRCFDPRSGNIKQIRVAHSFVEE